MPIVELITPRAKVRVADEAILVDRRRFHDRLRGERLLPSVDVAEPPERIAQWDVVDEPDWTGETPDHPAAAVAHGRRPERGNEQVRALREAPLAEGDAEVVAILGDAHHRGEVEDAAEPEARVEEHAPERVSRAIAVALQQSVDAREQIVDVAEEVRHTIAD